MERIPTSSSITRDPSTEEKRDEVITFGYLKDLDITEKDLVGKRVLDIGAGDGEFARWANHHGSDVTSIGLGLGEEQTRALTQYVVADAVALPFADNTFDVVVSLHAVPNVVAVVGGGPIPRNEIVKRDHERRMSAVREAIRVLKPGGEIRFAPVVRNERNARGPDRNVSMETMIAELKSDDSLEVREDILEKDHRGFRNIVSDTYRIIIRKKDTLPRQ